MLLQGKGKMTTYWLYGKDDFSGPLPDFDTLSSEDDPKPIKLTPSTEIIPDKPSPDSSSITLARPSVESGYYEKFVNTNNNNADITKQTKITTSLHDGNQYKERETAYTAFQLESHISDISDRPASTQTVEKDPMIVGYRSKTTLGIRSANVQPHDNIDKPVPREAFV